MTISSALLGGIVFNGYDSDGVFWGMDTLEGWGSPSTDAAYVKKIGQHGAWSTVDNPTMTERSISIGGTVKAPTQALRVQAQHRLKAAVTFALSQFSAIEMSGEKLTCWAQRDGDVLISPDNLNFTWSAQMKAPDSRLYGDAIRPAPTGLPKQAGGISWPVSWPVSWPSTTVSGLITVTNLGNVPAPVQFRIDGPVRGPYLRQVNTGRELSFTSDFQLTAGSWLDIDMDNFSVLEGGTAPRNAYLKSRQFFNLEPGVNQIVFGAQDYNPDARVTLSSASAYQ